MECVPNFSEGRDLAKIEKIVDKFRAKAGVKLLDYSNDEDHNRLVVTVVGEPEALKDALLEAVGQAVELIDLTKHSGQHPRMGAVDVVPFIPIRGCTMDEAIALSKEVGEKVAALYHVPVFLYEKSASAPHRENLAAIRKGEFEGMEEKIRLPEWKPDFGPAERHPTAGTVAIGARMPLVAYNVNLGTANLEIASSIAKKIRFIGGGLRYCGRRRDQGGDRQHLPVRRVFFAPDSHAAEQVQVGALLPTASHFGSRRSAELFPLPLCAVPAPCSPRVSPADALLLVRNGADQSGLYHYQKLQLHQLSRRGVLCAGSGAGPYALWYLQDIFGFCLCDFCSADLLAGRSGAGRGAGGHGDLCLAGRCAHQPDDPGSPGLL